MRAEKWKNAALSAVLSCLAVFGGLGCLVTGMRLEAEMLTLLLGCAIMAIVFCICFQTKLWLLPVGVAALLLGYWWQEGTLRLSFESLLYCLSDLYDQGYGWGIAQWSERTELSADVTAAVLALAVPLSAAVSAALVNEGIGWMGAGAALLPMLPTVLLKDTVPGEGYLAMLLFAVAMMLLTDGVRRRDMRQSNRLTVMLALPLAAAVGLLFLLIPRDGYNGQEGAQRLENLVMQVLNLSEAPELLELPGFTTGDQERVIDLQAVGDRKETSTRIMTVKGQETRTVYLRGCAYDVYDGTSWSSTPGWNAQGLYFAVGGKEIRQLIIETESVHSVMYFTYAPYEEDRKIMGGRLRNEDSLRRYTARYVDLVTYSRQWEQIDGDYDEKQLAEYLQLPEETRRRAESLLRNKIGMPTGGSAGQVWRNADLIVDWVSSRAEYDLKTPPMPEGETDFAMWFLEQGETGFCTHYASAAVVLLRAAGIPAQYVTGYTVDLRAGREIAVTAADAHAWVEVYINGVGWVVMEPTPGYGISPEQTPQPTESQPTEPDGTTESTEPEETTHSTEKEQTETTEQTVASGAAETGTDPYNYPTKSVASTAGFGGVDPGTPEQQALGSVLLGVLAAIAALLALIGQWQLRVWLRKLRLRHGNPNRQALNRWALVEQMCALAKQTPPEPLHALAQKAKFSQHTISPEELMLLDRELTQLRQNLRKRNFAMQLVYTLVLALY